MLSFASRVRVLVLAGGVALSAGCDSRSPVERVVEERAAWNVEATSWAQLDDGRISLTVRLSGPVKTTLQDLSFRIDFYGPDGESFESRWVTVDVSGVERGTPLEESLVLAAPNGPVDGLAVDLTPSPAPEDRIHIKELQAVGPS